jgi:UDP-glucose 4-epimerase
LCSANRFDAVVHCAAIVGVVASIENPRAVMRVNVQGALNVLEAMRTFAIKRMVHISSNEVYGDFEAPIIDERHPLRPQLPYGISKAAVEQLGRTYRDQHGLECINLRGAWIYGPDFPRPRLPNILVDQVCRGEAVCLGRGGHSVMDYIHVDDFVDTVVAALDRSSHRHDTYNVGSGTGVSLFELAELVKQLMPSAEISVGPGRYEFGPGLPMRIQGALDITRARAELDFAPKVDIRRGLEELIRVGRGPVV